MVLNSIENPFVRVIVLISCTALGFATWEIESLRRFNHDETGPDSVKQYWFWRNALSHIVKQADLPCLDNRPHLSASTAEALFEVMKASLHPVVASTIPSNIKSAIELWVFLEERQNDPFPRWATIMRLLRSHSLPDGPSSVALLFEAYFRLCSERWPHLTDEDKKAVFLLVTRYHAPRFAPLVREWLEDNADTPCFRLYGHFIDHVHNLRSQEGDEDDEESDEEDNDESDDEDHDESDDEERQGKEQ